MIEGYSPENREREHSTFLKTFLEYKLGMSTPLTEIEKTNLERLYRRLQEIYSSDRAAQLYSSLARFTKEIQKDEQYKDNYRACLLWHLAALSTPDSNTCTFFDFDGDLSIEQFVDDFYHGRISVGETEAEDETIGHE